MSTKTTIAVAVIAGFVGGIVSQRIAPIAVHAQAQTSIPGEIRAESFVIVDGNRIPRGAFGIDGKGQPEIDATEHLHWVRWGESFGKGKSSVIPQQ